MLTLHHLEDSRSQRILWLLEELEIDYTLKTYARDPKTSLAPPELQKVHPLGKSPLLVDGERVVAESALIIRYLLDHHGGGRFRPATEDEQAREAYWLHYAEASLMPLLLVKLVLSRIKSGPVPFFIRPVTGMIADKVDAAFTAPQLDLHLRFIDDELAKSTWFAGDELTGADFQMSFPLEAGATRMDYGPFPRVQAFVNRVHARPAYQRALDKGGRYAYGPKR